MKIANVWTAVIDGNFPWVPVRIETDKGIAGGGETYWGAGVAELVHHAKPLLIGGDPTISTGQGLSPSVRSHYFRGEPHA